MKRIDAFLNGITMYRLMLYGLLAIVAAAFASAALGRLGYPVVALAGSLAILMAAGFVAQKCFARLFRVATNNESWIISLLILFLILKPAGDLADYAVLLLGAVLAMASKFVLTSGNQHIFNPAAIALVLLGLLGSGEIFWWVGSADLLPVVLIAGLLVVRKQRHWDMVLAFLVVATLAYLATRGADGFFKVLVLSGPLVFFALIMLTEPQTSPTSRRKRLIYATITGALFSLPFSFPPLYGSHELALVIGNLFAFLTGARRRFRLELRSVTPLGPALYECSFASDHPIPFYAGQYMEWTLPHARADSRGSRRYFTIASSPAEPDVKLAVRVDLVHGSSYKKHLLALRPGDEIWASQPAGDFTLPKSPAAKLVFIAGGIGITPFRSMVRHLMDSGQQRDAVLYYTSQTADGFAYWQLFNEAAGSGLRSYYVITGQDVPAGWGGKTGYVTADMLRADMPDYTSRTYYLSGPNVMVGSYKTMLLQAGVPRRQIRTDYFPGY